MRSLGAMTAVLILWAWACASTVENGAMPAEDQYAEAVEAYEQGDYTEAIAAFQTFAFNYPQDPRIADARWLTAEAYYGVEDWATAAQEYLNFQRDYPAEPRAAQALYQAARSYQHMSLRPELDQSDTRRAIGVFERLLAEYPGSELAVEARERRTDLRDKLAEKVYLTAEYYFDNEEYRAAEIYLVDLIENHADSVWLAASYALLAETLCEQGETVRSAEVFALMQEASPESETTRGAADRLPERCRQPAAPAARAEAEQG
ncbi:hypothetical protein BH18GEM1_BH18GEM1_01310 [soil metagenome]